MQNHHRPINTIDHLVVVVVLVTLRMEATHQEEVAVAVAVVLATLRTEATHQEEVAVEDFRQVEVSRLVDFRQVVVASHQEVAVSLQEAAVSLQVEVATKLFQVVCKHQKDNLLTHNC